MTISLSDRQQVLESNRALRECAGGLRSWSREARTSSSSQRLRSQDLRVEAVISRTLVEGALGRSSARCTSLSDPVLPSFDDVGVDELLAVLVGCHQLSPMSAVRALRVALFMAGYPPESEKVLAQDALDIVGSALHHPG